jgi:hypothetical protein
MSWFEIVKGIFMANSASDSHHTEEGALRLEPDRIIPGFDIEVIDASEQAVVRKILSGLAELEESNAAGFEITWSPTSQHQGDSYLSPEAVEQLTQYLRENYSPNCSIEEVGDSNTGSRLIVKL